MSDEFELPVAPWDKRKNESPVNAAVKKYAKEFDCKAIRILRTTENHVPDWLIVNRVGKVVWMENKRKGAEPRRAQALRHEELAGYNIAVFVCDDDESVLQVFRDHLDVWPPDV